MPDRPAPAPSITAEPVSQGSRDAPPIAPRHDLPSGHVWPVPDGRRVLERLTGQTLVPAPRPPGASDLCYHAGGLCLRTRPQWRHPDIDSGCDALRALVRGFARLGVLRPTDIVLALAAGGDDAVLWHVVPILRSLADTLQAAPTDARPLVRLADAHATALRLAAREGFVLNLAADAFAVQDGRLVYIAADIAPRDRTPELASRLLAAVGRLSPPQLDTYAEALTAELASALTRADVAALGLLDGLAAAADSPARDCVREALRRCA